MAPDSSTSHLDAAVEAVRNGGLVIFPTETVYGVGADPFDSAAVARIFVAKGRPRTQALSLHLAADPDLDRWARQVPLGARRLAEQFWPGPLTLILASRPDVPESVRAGGDTVGLRVPAHEVALELCARAGGALAGTSANRHGEPSPTTVDEAVAAVGDDVAAVLDGGPCRLGVDSTVLDLSRRPPRLLRVGALTADELESVLGEEVEPA